jgi:hypothetical protein
MTTTTTTTATTTTTPSTQLAQTPVPDVTGVHVALKHSSQVNRVQIGEKNYNITKLEMMVNGKWEEVNLKKYTLVERDELIQACLKIHTSMLGNTSGGKTLTYHFEIQQDEKQTFSNRLRGNYKTSVVFKKIESTTEGGKTEVHKLEEFAPAVQLTVRNTLGKVATKFKEVFAKPQEHLKIPDRKPVQDMSAVDKILNVIDAGSANMRCAARSVALIMMSNNNGDLSEASAEDEEEEDLAGALAEGLIKNAVAVIQAKDSFVDVHHEHHSHIIAALADAGHPAQLNETPRALVTRYAQLMGTPGEMLDAPFFDALDIQKQSFVTLEAVDGSYEIRRISSNICLSEKIDAHELEDIYFVVYVNQNHYRAVIRNGQANQLDLLRDIMKADMNKSFTALNTELAQMTRTTANFTDNRNKLEGIIKHLITTYPADSKTAIIAALKAKNNALDDNRLKDVLNDNFAQAAVYDFLSSGAVQVAN